MSGRLSLAEAEQLVADRLGATPRAAHSRFVGLAMGQLAQELGADAELWRVVGLVHDLDYFAVGTDWSRHGLLTAEWLSDRLPAEALAAIAAHDHRTGLQSETLIAQLLKLADGLAVLDETAGREQTVAALRGGVSALGEIIGIRPFLVDIIGGIAARRGLDYAMLADVLEGMPRQHQHGT
jgi:predicted hydrolase (HD superfamily)